MRIWTAGYFGLTLFVADDYADSGIALFTTNRNVALAILHKNTLYMDERQAQQSDWMMKLARVVLGEGQLNGLGDVEIKRKITPSCLYFRAVSPAWLKERVTLVAKGL